MTRVARTLALAALVLAGPSLAGCIGSTDDGENLPPLNESANESLPLLPPDNRSGDFAAFKETNATEEGVGGNEHDHDYWAGRSRVTLFKAHAAMYPFPDDRNRATVVFRPPPPALVYEGTARVEILLESPQRRVCNPTFTLNGRFLCAPEAPDPGTAAGLELSFLHGASDPDAWVKAGTIAWGETFAIDVKDPRWTDMPHSTASLWAFRFESPQPLDATLAFDVQMDIVRAEGHVPEWPGHPDFYTKGRTRPIYDGPGEVEEKSAADDGGGLESPAIPAKLISYGTRTLHVWANVTNVEGVTPTNWYLYFHNASATNWNTTDPFSPQYASDKKALYWTLPVDGNAMDTPYASLSRWEFMVRGAYSTPAISCISDCGIPYKVSYNLAIVATDVALDAYSVTRPSVAR